MKRPIDEIFRSVRSELEKGLKETVTNLDRRARKDLQDVSIRLKKLKDEELQVVGKKVSDVRESFQSGEAFRPYMAALDAAIKAYREVKEQKSSKPKKKKAKSSKKKKVKKKKVTKKVSKKKTTKKKTAKKKTKRSG